MSSVRARMDRLGELGVAAHSVTVAPDVDDVAAVRIPTKLSTHSERSRPGVPGQAVHRFRAKPSGLSGDPERVLEHG